jgi:hypothetical protein
VQGRSAPQRGLPPRRIDPTGHGELVQGVIEQLERSDLEDPLAYLHGHYPSVGNLPDDG